MKLFEPITIRGMQIKNRIVMAPTSNFYHPRSPQTRDYLVERAKGGLGAIILDATPVDVFRSERFVGGLGEWIIDPLHEYGVKVGPQLWQGNLYATQQKGKMREWIAPSAGTPLGAMPLVPIIRAESECYCREVTISEIEEIIGRIATSAAKAKEVGFDFVEIHGAHGVGLAEQFFSPRDNRRTDIYGGDLEGRMRFSIELARAIRGAIGDLPLFWRISIQDATPGGATLDDTIQLAQGLVKAGVDLIDCSFGHEYVDESAPPSGVPYCPDSDLPMGPWVPLVEILKRRLSSPVMVVGRINSPDFAEEILNQRKADIIGLSRQLLADAYWPQKVAEGRLSDIRPCIACNQCVMMWKWEQKPIECTVNPELGKEKDYRTKPTKAKKVCVVGGGPAGMEAALLAAQRGHKVVLAERGDRLGGVMLLAAKIPAKQMVLEDLIKYFINQLEKSQVEVMLNEEISLDSIEKMKPDAVIVATGGEPHVPNIPGLKVDNVVTATDILSGRKEAGDRVIIIGGSLVGCDTAEFLATKGKKVVIIEVLNLIAGEEYAEKRRFLCLKLGAKGVTMMPGIKSEEIIENGLIVTDRWNREHTIEADTIVIATGAKPNDKLAKELEGKVPELYSIGDCVKPRKVFEAIHEGASIALQL